MTSPIADRLGVQSFCFRGFKDNAQVAGMVRELGLERIELCAVHADFNDLNRWKGVLQTYEDAGVRIVSLGVQTFTGDEATERNWFECAKAAGAEHISAHFNIDTYREAIPVAAKLCREYGIRLAVHCHGGYRFGGSPDVMRHLLEVGGPEIGVCLDTAWAMQIGPKHGDPVDWADQFADRLYGVHVKDFTFEPNGQWNDVVVGTGNLDLPALIDKLEQKRFAGYIVLEYEADVEDPVPALKQCVQQVRDAAAQ